MSKQPSFEQLVNLYLDNELNAQQFGLLCKQLESDAGLRKQFLALSSLDFAIGQAAEHRDRQNTIEAVLAQVEQEPEKDVIFELYRSIHSNPQSSSDRPLGRRDVLPLAGFVARKALRDTRVVSGLVAALLLIGVFLFVQISGPGGEPSADDRVANDSLESDGPMEPANLVAVATLTAERDASWERRPGIDLYAGQRLTLTNGFAEISTHRGAIAILQAPATIELTNHDNAIQLHAGKLVGICETDASKGFLVHTPHLHITDIGTRFGVDTNAIGTEVHVFEGEVEADRVNAPATTSPITLVADQSAHTSADTDVITRIDHDTDRFAALLPTTTTLPGTGLGLAVGEIDPNWQIVSIDGQALDKPQRLRVVGLKVYTERSPNDPATSQWLAWQPSPAPEAERVVYRFQTRITLPDSEATQQGRIACRIAVDNSLQSVLINGQAITVPPRDKEKVLQALPIDQHLLPGENLIAFDVVNLNPKSPVGLQLQWEYQAERASAFDDGQSLQP